LAEFGGTTKAAARYPTAALKICCLSAPGSKFIATAAFVLFVKVHDLPAPVASRTEPIRQLAESSTKATVWQRRSHQLGRREGNRAGAE